MSISDFNSRPHEEVDPPPVPIPFNFSIFQLTTSRRGRQAVAGFQGRPGHISTHDLTKRSTVRAYVMRYFVHISTHDLTKRSTFRRSAILSIWLFQLTTSRRGRPGRLVRCNGGAGISTHDLTKRSTLIFFGEVQSARNFNSRPHEEVDG